MNESVNLLIIQLFSQSQNISSASLSYVKLEIDPIKKILNFKSCFMLANEQPNTPAQNNREVGIRRGKKRILEVGQVGVITAC